MIECRITDDPLASALCWFFGMDFQDGGLDTGVEETRFVPEGSSYRPIRVLEGAADDTLSGPEIYERVIKVWPRFLDPRRIDDDGVRRALEGETGRIRTALRRTALVSGSDAYNQEFGRRLFLYMTRPVAAGGLGLRFDTADGGTRALAQVHRDRLATCLEFTNFYLEACTMAGIEAVPLELLRQGRNVGMHVAVGFRNRSGSVTAIADLQAPDRFAAPNPRDLWSPVSRRELLAYYYNARAVRNPDPERGEADLDLALRLNPGNYLLLFNKAYFADRGGRLEEARDLLTRAADANPLYAPAYANLNSVALRLRDARLADWAWERYAASVAASRF